MSPEFRVSVSEEQTHYLRSFVKHLKGSRIEEIKPKVKKDRKVRDPKRDEDLILRINEIFMTLPEEISVSSLHRWSGRFYNTPDSWLNFMRGLKHGDKTVISFAFDALPDSVKTLGDLKDLTSEQISERKTGVGEKSANFARTMVQAYQSSLNERG